MRRKLLREYYNLAMNDMLKTKKGKGFKLVYVDPSTSTDRTIDHKELMKKYGMTYLPYDKYIKNLQGVPNAWGWIIWDGSEDRIYPMIKKFAEEIGSQETPPSGNKNRTMEEVLASIEQLKSAIINSQNTEGLDGIDGEAIVNKAEELKKKLIQGIGSKTTMDALASLVRFRNEMNKHRSHALSWMNTILVFLQKRNASDVRSRGEWREMGYTPKPDAKPIVLTMPAVFKKFFGAQYDEIVRKFLEKEGVKAISELMPSQKRRLERETRYPDMSGGFKSYIAYDISDLIKGENAEEFPTNDFKWYDADSDETQKERTLIDAVIAFGKSIGVRSYEFASASDLGGARGSASKYGDIKIIDDKKNHGLLSTVIHETAHQIMHWETVKTTTPSMAKYYRGGSALRGSDIVEQEAELCAWIVLSGFGYENQQEHFNYLANWGMNEANCSKVFDDIMKVADYMYNGIIEKLSDRNNKQ